MHGPLVVLLQQDCADLGSPWLEDGPDDGQAEAVFGGFQGESCLEALRGELTTAQLATKHGVHQTMISEWKRQAVAGLAAVFSGKTEAKDGHPGRRSGEAARQDRAACGGTGFFVESLRSMSVERRRAMIDPAHPHLSVVRQCALVSIGRSTFYRAPTPETAANLALMRLLDEQFLETPWYGSRQMARHLCRLGHAVGRKRVRRLMARMGLAAIYQRPRTTVPHPEHRIYPYLLRHLLVGSAEPSLVR